jgi:hypothetical protein
MDNLIGEKRLVWMDGEGSAEVPAPAEVETSGENSNEIYGPLETPEVFANRMKLDFSNFKQRIESDKNYPNVYKERFLRALEENFIPIGKVPWVAEKSLKEYVMILQTFLFQNSFDSKWLGKYGSGKNGVDGLFGPRTEAALKAFVLGGKAENFGIIVDGDQNAINIHDVDLADLHKLRDRFLFLLDGNVDASVLGTMDLNDVEGFIEAVRYGENEFKGLPIIGYLREAVLILEKLERDVNLKEILERDVIALLTYIKKDLKISDYNKITGFMHGTKFYGPYLLYNLTADDLNDYDIDLLRKIVGNFAKFKQELTPPPVLSSSGRAVPLSGTEA